MSSDLSVWGRLWRRLLPARTAAPAGQTKTRPLPPTENPLPRVARFSRVAPIEGSLPRAAGHSQVAPIEGSLPRAARHPQVPPIERPLPRTAGRPQVAAIEGSFPQAAGPPHVVPIESRLPRAAKDSRVAQSSKLIVPVHGSEVVALHLGIDFGTRFTKVCFRDLGHGRSELVTFAAPGESPSLKTALLSSRVAIDGDRIIAGLREDEWVEVSKRPHIVPIDFIKIRLAQLDIPARSGEWVPARVSRCGADEMVEALAIFYLSRVISRACQWIESNHRALLAGRRVQWSFSVGLPVKDVDSSARQRFEHVLRAAASLALRGMLEGPSLDDLSAMLAGLVEPGVATTVSVQPEIAAAIRSFIASPNALEGVYVYVDIGAGTIDGASFRFNRPPDERPQLHLYSAEIQPLGMAAVAAEIARKTNCGPDEAEEILYRKDGDAAFGNALDPSRRLINRFVASVILGGRLVDRRGWEDGLEQLANALHRRRSGAERTTRDVPLFIGGGGSLSSFYRTAVISTYRANNLSATGVRRYSLEEPLMPDDLGMSDLPHDEFHRFAVAYGLSIPPEAAATIGPFSSTVPSRGP